MAERRVRWRFRIVVLAGRSLFLSALLSTPFVHAAPAANASDAPSSLHDHVLVVVNEADPTSSAIGEAYRLARGLAESQLFAIETDPARTISHGTFRDAIRDPIARHLESTGRVESVTVIVLARGVPLRTVTEHADGSRWLDGTEASVDAELALLHTGLDGRPAFGPESIANPYFGVDEPFAHFRSRHPESPLRYLVARLTAYVRISDDEAPADEGAVPPDIAALIARAQAPGSEAVYVVDEDPNQPVSRTWGNTELLRPAATRLAALGLAVLHDTSPTFVSGVPAVAGYASWGSNDVQSPEPPTYDAATPGVFAARAIVVDFVSTNARSFAWPPSYGQSLVADLIALGASGAAGHVFEPTLGRAARPEILFDHHARGAPAGEAFFRSLTHLGGVNVYVGDPLMTCDPGIPSVCAVPEPGANASALASLAALAMLARHRSRPPRLRQLGARLDPRPQ